MIEQATRATLYLGAHIGGMPGVTDTDFSLFLEDQVTPRFPGFTVREVLGYWNGKSEPSRELVILGNGTQKFRDDVTAIAQIYKARFKQEAVMLAYEPVQVAWDVPLTGVADYVMLSSNPNWG